MKYILTVLVLALLSNVGLCQEKHFVFFQSESRQPFNVFVNGKTYTSTASGYVIIPQLSDGNYTFAVSFAKDEIPEQGFNYTLNKDLGLSLKNFGDKGWGLFNMQSLTVTLGTALKASDLGLAKTEKKEDKPISFQVKKEAPTAVQPVSTTETIEPITSNGTEKETVKSTDSVQATSTVANQRVEEVTVKKLPTKKSSAGKIKKISETAEEDAVRLTFTDKDGSQNDTINIIVPGQASVLQSQQSAAGGKKTESPMIESNENTAGTSKSKENGSSSSKKDVKFLEMEGNKSVNSDKSITEDQNSVTEREDCKDNASDDDYAKLRRKMARETTDEEMMKEAGKVFKFKCFSTSQIKSLSTLFLSDEGRFNFFQTSLPYVSDPNKYSDLEKEFIDVSSAKRFKAMLTK